ncbi:MULTISPECIES: O-antigen ligase family protein [Calothrix]|uniref:O-antigen ligase family protein n=2 Tax=Calothrix TaxID=1186 RepID=A0ABR8AI94_9CYAN|nr:MULTISPECIES: O-antigen ligase family protein [Calothrix]MBD2199683.1 O-antigen ligase family protein [Calothrix parietina FACHB-288]MBD2228480.1 O-antigen ligase family protein [Calothrix anomala FACHB-343]
MLEITYRQEQSATLKLVAQLCQALENAGINYFSGVVFSLPFFVPETLFSRLQSTGSEITSGDLNGRLIIWREGLASFLKHPFLGVGLGAIRTTNSLGKVAHNSFISVLVEVGAIGLLLFLAIFLLVCYLASRQPKVHSMFWLTLLIIWTIGASTLTWECFTGMFRKFLIIMNKVCINC